MKKFFRKIFNFTVDYSINGKAAFFTLIIAYIYITVEIILKMSVSNKVSTWEILLLFIMYSSYGIFKKVFNNSSIPNDYKGNPLPTDNSEKSKTIRNKSYKISALIYSGVFAVINLFALLTSSRINGVNLAVEVFFDTEVPNFVIASMLTGIVFLILYLISYISEYLYCEYLVYQNNARLFEAVEMTENTVNNKENAETVQSKQE